VCGETTALQLLGEPASPRPEDRGGVCEKIR
jgi:hypothetical protein